MSGPCWSVIRPGLVALLTELAQHPRGEQRPAWSAEWQDQARKATPVTGPLKGVTLTMKITSIVGIGGDEIRYEEAGEDLQETIYGLRRVTLNLQCEATQVDDEQWALSVLERINTRLSRSRSFDALIELNIGIIDILAARDISAKRQQHTLSRGSMDLILAMVASDEDPVTTGTIASVFIEGTVNDADFAVVDGETVSVPLTVLTNVTTP